MAPTREGEEILLQDPEVLGDKLAFGGGPVSRFLSPLRGWSYFSVLQPTVAPWAAFFRRFAALESHRIEAGCPHLNAY
jgi:hypothetical protein